MTGHEAVWPALAYDEWNECCTTLHLWTQIVGKVRLAKAPDTNHWWHVPLYVTARGLTTSPMPDRGRTFQIDFDFIEHALHIATSDGRRDSLPLVACPVAEFYGAVMSRLKALDVEVRIWTMPVEIADPIRFEQDRVHAAYDPEQAHRFWQALARADQVLKQFRAGFVGKASPVHLFWGAFDLAVTRFSGRPAPRHPGAPNVADRVTREAYSHEVSSCGFWPGNGSYRQAAFYSYAYPQPPGFPDIPDVPPEAFYDAELGEFVLPYAQVQQAGDPERLLLDFLQSTYAGAATLGKWDRAALER